MIKTPPKKVLPEAEVQRLAAENQFMAFVCRHFEVGEKQLKQMLKIIRKRTPDRDEWFPTDLFRQSAARANSGKYRWSDAILLVRKEALYDNIRRNKGQALFSPAGAIAWEIIELLNRLYAQIFQRLKASGVSPVQIHWVLVEEVFAPTILVILSENWRRGLGTEFQGARSWYLPTKTDIGIQKPVSQVLDRWMRAAGFLTAYGLAQPPSRRRHELDSEGENISSSCENQKKNAERWLSGVCPDREEIFKLIDKYSKQVEWLDQPSFWKGRFVLACAMQNVCEAMDKYFSSIHPESSLKLNEILMKIEKDPVMTDEGKFLVEPRTYFASRLVQLQSRKKFKTGDEFLSSIAARAKKDGQGNVEEYLFNLGIEALLKKLGQK